MEIKEAIKCLLARVNLAQNQNALLSLECDRALSFVLGQKTQISQGIWYITRGKVRMYVYTGIET